MSTTSLGDIRFAPHDTSGKSEQQMEGCRFRPSLCWSSSSKLAHPKSANFTESFAVLARSGWRHQHGLLVSDQKTRWPKLILTIKKRDGKWSKTYTSRFCWQAVRAWFIYRLKTMEPKHPKLPWHQQWWAALPKAPAGCSPAWCHGEWPVMILSNQQSNHVKPQITKI